MNLKFFDTRKSQDYSSVSTDPRLPKFHGRIFNISLKGGEGVKVRFRLSQHLRTILFIAGEPQQPDKQKYISPTSAFRKFFKNTTFRHLGSIGKTLP